MISVEVFINEYVSTDFCERFVHTHGHPRRDKSLFFGQYGLGREAGTGRREKELAQRARLMAEFEGKKRVS